MKDKRFRALCAGEYSPYYSVTLPENECHELFDLDQRNHYGKLSKQEKERMDFLFKKCLEEDKRVIVEHNKRYFLTWKIYEEALKTKTILSEKKTLDLLSKLTFGKEGKTDIICPKCNTEIIQKRNQDLYIICCQTY